MTASLSMAEAAQAVGLAYDTFRKRWRAMVGEEGFPAPFQGRRWDGEAIAAWRLRRSHRALARKAANDPASPGARRAQAEAYAALQQLRSA